MDIFNLTCRYALYIIYFPRECRINGREWRKLVFLLMINLCFLASISTISICIKLFAASPETLLLRWARILGFISLILTTCQCAPQIYKTWKIKEVGALSIPAMALQTPGTFLLIVSLALRPDSDYSMWISYLISGTSQGILLSQCIYYSRFHRQSPPIIEGSDPRNSPISEKLELG